MSIWFVQPTHANFTAQSRGTMIEHLAIEFIATGEDFVSARMPVDARTVQPYGLLHGGASVALAETLGSMAAACCVDPTKKMVVGLDINANHVRGARSGFVIGTARPLHLGGSTQVWEIRIVDERDKLVCISRLTMAVLDRAA
ncbi:MAG: hotdog fold thioesterase [Thermoflexales bacterium]|nr:hotdog fold thioesterase [Thermoflexales bacterium]